MKSDYERVRRELENSIDTSLEATPVTVVVMGPSLDEDTPAARLRELIQNPELTFIMEAHNGLSAKIAEEAGFEAIWASGLSDQVSSALSSELDHKP